MALGRNRGEVCADEKGVHIANCSKLHFLHNFAGMRRVCGRTIGRAIKFARIGANRTGDAACAAHPGSAFAWISCRHGTPRGRRSAVQRRREFHPWCSPSSSS
jgi:hypothetical protein